MTSTPYTKEKITQELITVLENMTSDWDTGFSGKLTPATLIVSDLQFESIDVVQLIVQIETVFHRKDLPFEKLLMIDGRYKEDLRVQEVTDFLHEHL